MTAVVAWAAARRKAATALVGFGLTWAGMVVASPSGPITAAEWLAGAVGLASVLGVHAMTNDKAA